jgi:DNA-binding PadR family transcriptional regulator
MSVRHRDRRRGWLGVRVLAPSLSHSDLARRSAALIAAPSAHCRSNLPHGTSVKLTLMALKPLVFEILLALADRPRHGWDMVGDVEQRLGGEALLPGNFYRTLRRMLADGMIEETGTPKDATRDSAAERRRYFRLTTRGESIARAEARRLAALVADRRTRRLLKAR